MITAMTTVILILALAAVGALIRVAWWALVVALCLASEAGGQVTDRR